MPPFTISRDCALDPAAAWARVTDWPRHARHVPWTTITVRTPPPSGLGTVFVARTEIAGLGFDDPMEVTAWDPPRFCRLDKRGRALLGWAELSVAARGAGSRVTWREVARPAVLPGFTDAASAATGRLLFGRVLRRLLDEAG